MTPTNKYEIEKLIGELENETSSGHDQTLFQTFC